MTLMLDRSLLNFWLWNKELVLTVVGVANDTDVQEVLDSTQCSLARLVLSL